MVAIPMMIVLILLAKGIGGWMGRTAAKKEMAAAASTPTRGSQIPAGVLGTEWGMNKEQVRSVVSDARPFKEDSLRNSAEYMGRAATIVYQFDGDKLIAVLINFDGTSTEADYAAMQEKLTAEYGSLPTPGADEEFKLLSRREEKRLGLAHMLMDVKTSIGVILPKEQVVFYIAE